jgi:hypothetical protein
MPSIILSAIAYRKTSKETGQEGIARKRRETRERKGR